MVTGGSKGLGLGIVERLLEDGYRVSTCSRSRSDELTRVLEDPNRRNRVFWHACAIGEEVEEATFFDAALAWSGDAGLYGLINNAAIAGEGIHATFPEVDMERILRINLLGSLRMARRASRVLLQNRDGGRIVNISSIVGSRGYTGLASYAASKAGLDGMTRALARELGRRNVTVNSVAPGYMVTQMSATLGGAQKQQIVNRTPLRRLATVEDITPVVSFLLSEGARFITGQTLIVDGGITS